jgi:hypothetical protein
MWSQKNITSAWKDIRANESTKRSMKIFSAGPAYSYGQILKETLQPDFHISGECLFKHQWIKW